MSKFKIGDKVRVVNSMNCYNPLYKNYVGLEAMVLDVFDYDDDVLLDLNSINGNKETYWREQELELIE